MKIIIRANGGTTVGMGHLMRCSVLADQLRKFATVVFVCEKRDEFISGTKFLINKNYQVITLETETFLEKLCKIRGDAIITDCYDVNENYFNMIKDAFPVSGYIDDTNLLRFNVDFILNQNIYATKLNYDVPEGTTMLLGSDYLLLRDEFNNIPPKITANEIENVLITLGGADNDNLTEKLIKTVTTRYPNLILHVVIGPSFIHADKLDELASKKVLLYNSPKMANLMLKMDIAISACGSTIYELACCGVPTIGIVVADNQRLVAETMDDLGLLKYAHNIDNITKIISDLNYNLRDKMSREAQQTFHCRGAQNAADKIKELTISRYLFGISKSETPHERN